MKEEFTLMREGLVLRAGGLGISEDNEVFSFKKLYFFIMSANEVRSENFSMTGPILMTVVRLYANLYRGKQIHNMILH